jgi:hypothetical protein
MITLAFGTHLPLVVYHLLLPVQQIQFYKAWNEVIGDVLSLET